MNEDIIDVHRFAFRNLILVAAAFESLWNLYICNSLIALKELKVRAEFGL